MADATTQATIPRGKTGAKEEDEEEGEGIGGEGDTTMVTTISNHNRAAEKRREKKHAERAMVRQVSISPGGS